MKSVSLLLLLLVCVQWTQARLLPPTSSNANLDTIPTHQPLQSPTLLRALLRARAGPNAPSTNWRMPSRKEDLPPQLDSNSIERTDEIQAIPFTRHRGTARFNGIPPLSSGKVEEGVGPAVSFPAPIASSSAAFNKPSSIIDDVEDDLLMSDDGPTVAATVVTTTGNVVPTASLLKEQLNSRSLSSSLPSVQYSELHPVYIKPPEDFKPVLYAHRRADGVAPGNRASVALVQPVSAQSGLPYGYPNGLSSWMLGGFRGTQRGGYWERLASDQALADRSKPLEPSEQPANNWLLTPAAQAVWYVQTVRDQKQKQSNQRPPITTTDKVDLVPLDAEVGDKDAYDTSASTLSRISIRPPVGHNHKFVKESDQDLMMSGSQQRPRAQKRS